MSSLCHLVVLLVLAAGAVLPGVHTAEAGEPANPYVTNGRYGLVEVGPEQAQLHPMRAIVNIRFGSEIETIGDAIEELLFGSGYSYRKPVGVEKVLQSQAMPAVLQQIGPVTLKQALTVLGGKAWDVGVDELRKQVSYRLNDGYAGQKEALAIELHQQGQQAKGDGCGEKVLQSFRVAFASGTSWVPLDQASIRSAVSAIKNAQKNAQADRDNDGSVSVRVTGISHSTQRNGNSGFAQNRAEQVRQYLRFGGVSERLFQPNEISVKNHQPSMEAGAVIDILAIHPKAGYEAGAMVSASEAGAASRDYELVFDIRREQTLESNLQSWVRLANEVHPGANYQLVWQYPNDVLIEADAVYYGTFESALEQLIKEFHETTGKPIGLQLDKNVARIMHREAKK